MTMDEQIFSAGSSVRYVRFGYTFESEKAVRFFDTVLKQHLQAGEPIQDFDVFKIVVQSAHKFRSFAYRKGFATCDGGYVTGERALEAAKTINDSLDHYYDSLPEFRRSYAMQEYRDALIPAVEKEYHIVFLERS